MNVIEYIKTSRHFVEYDLLKCAADRVNRDKTELRDLINKRNEKEWKRPGLNGTPDKAQTVLLHALDLLQEKYDAITDNVLKIEDTATDEMRAYYYEEDHV